jgi:hypothetical protein
MPQVQPAQLIFRIQLIVFFAGLSACVLPAAHAAQAENALQAAVPDDGWRRTADGWERIESWHIAPVARAIQQAAHLSASSEAVPARRSDFHPAILVVFQVLAVTAGYSLLPLFQRRPEAGPAFNGVHSAIVAQSAGVLAA